MGGEAAAGDSAGLAMQVIVLGSGGGPLESNVTSLLVRSLAEGWRKGSVVSVDAGVHLSAIQRILEKTQPAGLGTTDDLSLPYTLQTGPFAGLQLPHACATANTGYIYRNLIDTYLITHPHLDHISGFVINTAAPPGSRPKRLAGLPSTISAFKNHIFNNVIWPNLSDENNGAGLVTYMRLMDGGSPAFGDGDGKGYLEISNGLAVKIWGVSHGHCIEKHSHRGSGTSTGTRFSSMDTPMGLAPVPMSRASSLGLPLMSPRTLVNHNPVPTPALASFLLQQQHQQQPQPHRSPSLGYAGGGHSGSMSGGGLVPMGESVCVYDSSAYFIRDVATGREILIFGDVEPDAISLSPRNHKVWEEAAPKIAAGTLAAIFIECSFDDSQTDDRLYGHLAPRYVADEMLVLAQEVRNFKVANAQSDSDSGQGRSGSTAGSEKKRKREPGDCKVPRRKTTMPPSVASVTSAPAELQQQQRFDNAAISIAANSAPTPTPTTDDAVSPKTVNPVTRGSRHGSLDELSTLDSPHLAAPTAALSLGDVSAPGTPLSMHQQQASVAHPLAGLRVVIIHVKDKLDDGPKEGQTVLAELRNYEKDAQLGCEYIISAPGQDLYF